MGLDQLDGEARFTYTTTADHYQLVFSEELQAHIISHFLLRDAIAEEFPPLTFDAIATVCDGRSVGERRCKAGRAARRIVSRRSSYRLVRRNSLSSY
jgi:hypothetical protein